MVTGWDRSRWPSDQLINLTASSPQQKLKVGLSISFVLGGGGGTSQLGSSTCSGSVRQICE